MWFRCGTTLVVAELAGVVGVTDRVKLGWRIPENVWTAFETYVEEKHGSTAEYLCFELEEAMREYLDEDDILAEAEELLEEYTDLQGLSSSTEMVSIATNRYRGAETQKVQNRVNSELKERFQIFADKHDANSYGHALAAALDSYVDGGRERRILADVERLITAGSSSGTTTDTEETHTSDTVSGRTTDEDEVPTPEQERSSEEECGSIVEPDVVDVEARLVLAVVDELPSAENLTETVLPHKVVEQAIVRVVEPSSEEEIQAYVDAVLEQLDAGPHPHYENRYITEAYRDSHIIWADLNRENRVRLLRRFAAQSALEQETQEVRFGYKKVKSLFKDYAGNGEPSNQYAYKLMDAAANEPGFDYNEFNGQLKLQVSLADVSDEILKYAVENTGGVRLSDIGLQGQLEDYNAASLPDQESAGDD
jgi:hypothetical protein